jgi:membrane associated rhomboid family serine protease
MAHTYGVIPKRRGIFDSFSVNTQLIIINVVCFIIFSILIYKNNSFLDYIALKPSNIFAGKYLWTFLTSMFMHGGFFHIFVNMFSMLFVGSLVEKIIGRKRFLWFYLIAGLFAGILFVALSLLFSLDFNVYAVGASGALFGLIGLLMILTPNIPVYVLFIPIPIKMKYAAPGMLLVLWLISIAGNVPIGNTAHLGGLVVGIIYGFYLKNRYKKKAAMLSKYFS